MASLFFPQLSSGALAQFPITRTRVVRTVKNVLASGDMIVYPDRRAGHLIWNLEYAELPNGDIDALQAHFAACAGPYRAFTFLDPVGNLLAWSSDLTQPLWGAPGSILIGTGVADPAGGSAAFSLTNNGQGEQGLTQTLPIPAAYQYVFSVYVQSASGATVALSRAGQSAAAVQTFSIGPAWRRIEISGTLQDLSATLAVSLSINSGQQVNVYAPQLEPQIAPSRARVTGMRSGVYTQAHWGVNSLPVVATAPGLFTTSFTIESAV